MSWMLMVPPSQVLPLKSPLGRGACVACDDCRVVFVRHHDATVMFPTVADAIASATTLCEGWEHTDDGTPHGHLQCLDCVTAREAADHPVIRSVVINDAGERL